MVSNVPLSAERCCRRSRRTDVNVSGDDLKPRIGQNAADLRPNAPAAPCYQRHSPHRDFPPGRHTGRLPGQFMYTCGRDVKRFLRFWLEFYAATGYHVSMTMQTRSQHVTETLRDWILTGTVSAGER